MKKILLTSMAALLIASNADAGWYAAGYVGTGAGRDDLFNTAALYNSVGYGFSNGIRIEADIFSMNIYDNDSSTDVNVNPTFGLGYLKGLYDFKVDGKFTPYVGLGVKELSLEYVKTPGNTYGFGFEMVGIVGASYPVTKSISVDIQYNRYFSYEWVKVPGQGSNSDGGDFGMIKAGAVFKF
ncbi:MAG: outer membrane beta-barrel protein [Rickettsiales bacterium]|jgi:opacity protein-like surface antigen|nr:outer membrane beta-barrel protein [Rickettsiales bacterium]